LEEIGIHHLKGDGDFRSDECIKLLKEADIVVTNPPFSLFREYVAQLIEYDKKFIIIGHQNALTYKETFPLIKENKMWLGFGFKGNAGHFINKHYEDYATASNHKEGMIRVSGVVWFTNLDISKRHEDLILYKKHNPDEYYNYDNYHAINVDKTKEIPIDYKGVIGVPITFMTKYNPEQFEILGTSDNGLIDNKFKKTLGLTKNFVDGYYKAGGTGVYNEGNPTAGYYKNGIATMAYKRIFIRNKKT
jgi:hypothetical protein